jgi:hypothetical protein
MTPPGQVQVRELVGWGVDDNDYRPQLNALTPAIERARCAVGACETYTPAEPVQTDWPAFFADLLSTQIHRRDLQSEMHGLDWSAGVVDLRCLLAFQRRLIFDEHFSQPEVPAPEDWAALIALAFGPPVAIAYSTRTANTSELVLQSENPNLQIRPSIESNRVLFEIHGGSPFFEVAEYRGRWFLRDGYHRAYHLLRANIAYFPAVIIRAKTLVELGPVQPWFFSEEVLFSSHPPRLTDFLDDNLVVEYLRPRLLKTLRVTIEESVEPAQPATSSGERQ